MCIITSRLPDRLSASVFNFWEPLHYLDRGHGFQTWETSPVYSIRSWAYILMHLWPAKLTSLLLGPEKVRVSLPLSAHIFTHFLSDPHSSPSVYSWP